MKIQDRFLIYKIHLNPFESILSSIPIYVSDQLHLLIQIVKLNMSYLSIENYYHVL